MADFDWSTWARNFPVTAERQPEEHGLPEGIEFHRAGKRVFVSLKELNEILKSTQGVITVLAEED